MSRLIVYLFVALPLSAEGIESFLNRKENIYFAGKSDNFSQTIIDIKSKQPDILIIDDTCLEADELSKFLGKINQCSWKRKILLYTSSNNPLYLRRLVDAGIKAMVHKINQPNIFLEACELVNITGIYTDQTIISILQKQNLLSSNSLENQINKLSDRQKEIFECFRLGMNNKEISERLFISYRTLEVHKSNIALKLGLKGRRDLLKFAIAVNKEVDK